jgi:hypothetical protein
MGAMVLIQIVAIILNALLQVFLLGPVLAGLTNVSLLQLQGRPWSFSDYFGGFKRYFKVVTLSVFTYLLGVLPYEGTQLLAQVYVFAAGPGPGGPPDVIAVLIQLSGFVWLIVFGFIWVKLFFFALPLVLDRNYSAVEAVKTSMSMSEGHYLGLLGIAVLLLLINIGGGLACGIGLLFTVPFTSLVFAAGYLFAIGKGPVVIDRNYDEDYGPRYRARRDDYDDRREDDYDDRRRRRDDDDDRRRRDDDYDDRRRDDDYDDRRDDRDRRRRDDF